MIDKGELDFTNPNTVNTLKIVTTVIPGNQFDQAALMVITNHKGIYRLDEETPPLHYFKVTVITFMCIHFHNPENINKFLP